MSSSDMEALSGDANRNGPQHGIASVTELNHDETDVSTDDDAGAGEAGIDVSHALLARKSESSSDEEVANLLPQKRKNVENEAENLYDQPLCIPEILQKMEQTLETDGRFPNGIIQKIKNYHESLLTKDVQLRMDYLASHNGASPLFNDEDEDDDNDMYDFYRSIVEELVGYMQRDTYMQQEGMAKHWIETIFQARCSAYYGGRFARMAFPRVVPIVLKILQLYHDRLRSQCCFLLMVLLGRVTYPNGILRFHTPTNGDYAETLPWTAECVDLLMATEGMLDALAPPLVLDEDGETTYYVPSTWSDNATDFAGKLFYISYKSIDERTDAPFRGQHDVLRTMYNATRDDVGGHPVLPPGTRGSDLAYGIVNVSKRTGVPA
mmetsp:Transcript_25814/g.48845  ORF Transcript_25814/g.48845 Transcript_25814/m.48845 type:complete len:379 (+) Transcript_25814:156-1292(+)